MSFVGGPILRTFKRIIKAAEATHIPSRPQEAEVDPPCTGIGDRRQDQSLQITFCFAQGVVSSSLLRRQIVRKYESGYLACGRRFDKSQRMEIFFGKSEL